MYGLVQIKPGVYLAAEYADKYGTGYDAGTDNGRGDDDAGKQR